MEAFWVVLAATLIAFCLYITHRNVYRAGYKAGAKRVLRNWKDFVQEFGEVGRDERKIREDNKRND